MKIKKSILTKAISTIFLMVLVVFIATPEVMSETITVEKVSGYYFSGGGEFSLYPSVGLQTVLSGYVEGLTRNIGAGGPNFQSFCMEHNEGVNSNGGVYGVLLNDRAINGGLDPSLGGDPVSKGTAYLYHEFQKGTLNGYNYTPADGRSPSAGALQQAFWFLEDEEEGVYNSYVALAVSQFGSLANAQHDNFQNGQREIPVMVLNLWEADEHGVYRYRHQDLLVGAPDPVPEPATIFLLGSGLLGLAGLARRRFGKR